MGIVRIILLPWWLLQLVTGAKAFDGNPLLGSPTLNRLGLHGVRVRAAAGLARWRRLLLRHRLPAEDRQAFDRDGYILRPDFLPADEFERLRAEVLAYRGPAREMRQGDTITRRFAVDAQALRALPGVRALLGRADWRGLLGYVGSFRSTPDAYIQTILSHAVPGEPDPQTALHADTFHATVKAWLFLTDVPEDEGPFVYVPGSHRMSAARLAWERARSIRARHGLDQLSARGSFRIDAGELEGLGLPSPRNFAVRANTLVVADTSGFHARGPSQRSAMRIEIWAYGRRNPFLPWTGFDPLGLPGLVRRRVPLMWALRDRLPRLLGQPWQPAGTMTPDAPSDTELQ